MKAPEELREHWKALSYPRMFDPEQPNWTDLAVREIADHLARRIGPMDRESTFRNYFVRADRGILEQPPFQLRNCVTGELLTIPHVFSDWESSHWIRSGQPFLDPEDEAYFEQPQHKQPLAILHESEPTAPVVFRLAPYGFLCSAFWEKNWAFRIDLAIKVGADLTEEQAKLLIHPQSVRNQFRSKTYPSLRMVNRAYLGFQKTDAASFNRYTCLEDGWLFYYQFVMVDREGNYPFSDETKKRVIKAAGDVISQSIRHEQVYRANLLRIWRFAKNQGTSLNIFAAREN